MVSKRSLQAKQKVQMVTIAAPLDAVPRAPMAQMTEVVDEIAAQSPLAAAGEEPTVEFGNCPHCAQKFPLAMLSMHTIIVHPAPSEKKPTITCGFRGCKFECERSEVMIHHKDIAHKDARMDEGELVVNIKESMEILKTEFMENNPGIACGLRFDVSENEEAEQQHENEGQQQQSEDFHQQQREEDLQLNSSSSLGDTSINSMTTVPPNTPTTSFAMSPIFSGGHTPIINAVANKFNSGVANMAATSSVNTPNATIKTNSGNANIVVTSPINTPNTTTTPTRGRGRGRGKTPAAQLLKTTLNAKAVSPAVKTTPQRGGAKKRNSPMPAKNVASPNQIARLANLEAMVNDGASAIGNPLAVQNLATASETKLPELAYKDSRTCPVLECAHAYKNAKNVRRHLELVHKLSETQIDKHWDKVAPGLM